MVCPGQPFDPESCDTRSIVLIIDIVYVDKLTVLIVAVFPAALRRALDTLLISLIELFSPLGLVIVWNPGKTGVMLVIPRQWVRGVSPLFTLTSTGAMFCRVTFPT